MMVRADLQAKANEAIANVDLDGGELTFTVGLARASDPTTPVAYWCSWDVDATGHSRQAIAQWLQNKGVPVGQLAEDGYWIDSQNRFAIADGDRHAPDVILDRLNLVRVDDGIR